LAAEALGVVMEELPEWQCCGAVYPLGRDEIATKLSAVRALDSAKTLNQPLLTLCSACHHVIKRVNHDMRSDKDLRAKVNNYMKPNVPYAGETQVVHYLEMLRDTVGFEALREKVTAPFTGKKIAAYYGCMLLRPSAVMSFDNPENPSIMEDFISAIGGTPVRYPYRNECCGGYVAIENPRTAKDLSTRIMLSAVERGADLIVTACPLCMYNLDANGSGLDKIPILYFTELLAQALGVKVPSTKDAGCEAGEGELIHAC
jgi:heterodisulfide reductase subunit B